jgi:hypothetical protein
MNYKTVQNAIYANTISLYRKNPRDKESVEEWLKHLVDKEYKVY